MDPIDAWKCNQMDCDSAPIFRITWPGHDVTLACLLHAVNIRNVAEDIGLQIQIEIITVAEMLRTPDKSDGQRPLEEL